jgi:hypothetical protein
MVTMQNAPTAVESEAAKRQSIIHLIIRFQTYVAGGGGQVQRPSENWDGIGRLFGVS